MASSWATDGQRFEYKYLVTEAQAQVIRGYACMYLAPDGHADAALGNAYPVYSLYLDSGGLALYYSSRGGDKNRFKLRVRGYDDCPDTPVFFEVKTRRGDAVGKRRACVRRDAVARLLGSFCPSSNDLAVRTAEACGAAHRFCELGAALMARPTAQVRYMREAYVDRDGGSLRLTMDREIACLRADRPMVEANGAGWVALRNRWVVLEIKFTDTVPHWAREMVEALGLARTSSAKYVQSVNALMNAAIAVA